MTISRRAMVGMLGVGGLTGLVALMRSVGRSTFVVRATPGKIQYHPVPELAKKYSSEIVRSLLADMVFVQQSKRISPDIHVHLIKLIPMAGFLFPLDSEQVRLLKDSLDFLLNQQRFELNLTDRLFLRTPYGVAYRTVPQARPMEYFNIVFGMSHRDAVLESLVEIGLPLSTTLTFADGGSAEAFDLVSDSVSRFSIPEFDLEWSATSYSYLLQPQSSWRNRNDDQFDFPLLTQHLVSSLNQVGPCFGVHRIIALAHILFSKSMGNCPMAIKLASAIREWCQILDRNQLDDGTWNSNYLASPTYGKYPQSGESPFDVVYSVTCHILEFLSLTPDSFFQKGQKAKMADKAIERLLSFARQPEYGGLDRNIASTCHGIRAIHQLSHF